MTQYLVGLEARRIDRPVKSVWRNGGDGEHMTRQQRRARLRREAHLKGGNRNWRAHLPLPEPVNHEIDGWKRVESLGG